MKINSMAAGLVIALASHSAFACNEPASPACTSRHELFQDQEDYERCRRDMTSYNDEVERFVHCVRDDAEQKVKQAVDEYNSMVQGFNRRAGK
jgi:hypothetical protein